MPKFGPSWPMMTFDLARHIIFTFMHLADAFIKNDL